MAGKGGARPGAGRRPLGQGTLDKIAEVKRLVDEHATTEHPYSFNGQVEKKMRVLLLLDKLFAMAVKGEGDVVAIKEYLNRTIGMPKQSLEHSGGLDIKTMMMTTQKIIETIKRFVPDAKTREEIAKTLEGIGSGQ